MTPDYAISFQRSVELPVMLQLAQLQCDQMMQSLREDIKTRHSLVGDHGSCDRKVGGEEQQHGSTAP